MNENFESIDKTNINQGTKKKSRGRKSFRNISKYSMTVRLYNGSASHIKRMVKELKGIDSNFDNDSAAVRHYVKIGIAAETATSDLRNSLDNSIVKRSIKNATKDELNSTNDKIDKLTGLVEAFAADHKGTLMDISNRAEIIETKLDVGYQKTSEMISEMLGNIQLSSDEILRNEIIIRCILYIFLIGHKTGRVSFGNDNSDIWRKIVFTAHDRVNQLSLVEIRKFKNNEMDRNLIHAVTKEIFNEVGRNKKHVKFDFPPPLEQPQITTK